MHSGFSFWFGDRLIAPKPGEGGSAFDLVISAFTSLGFW
jgi:hypothetical protein